MKRGFSLVELSIVLVILGLLVGGVLSGQALIRAAELRSVARQYAQYATAVQTFRDKYFALPGDMSNAQSFWGVAHATPATCITTASTSALTCNGDGDGLIEYGAAGSNETYRFWQHLANAGLIEGQYDGITHGSTSLSSTSANSPSGKLSSSLWIAADYSTQSGNAGLFDGIYGNVLALGTTTANEQPVTGLVKPEEIWNIDTKMDDGKPGIGKVVLRAYPSGLSACSTTVANNSATISADYLLTGTSMACAFVFRQQF